MGGMFQLKTFKTIEELMSFIVDQVKGAEACGLYLFFGDIRYRPPPLDDYEWFAYFSK